MTTNIAHHICRTLFIATLMGIVAGCAMPPPSSNTSPDMRQVQSSLDRQEQTVQNLSLQVTELEAQLHRQAEEIEQLRQSSQKKPAEYQPGQRMPAQAGDALPLQVESSPTEIYLQAFGDYASGRYQNAILGFETFLQRFPNNSYASNAQFWLGDCYFNLQQYAPSIQAFEKVLNNYNNAPKNPDALLKIAIAKLQLGDTEAARQTVETLNRRYPKSTATQKAQELAIP
jgi:tol-pal system protein YbgF